MNQQSFKHNKYLLHEWSIKDEFQTYTLSQILEETNINGNVDYRERHA
jgi:hypothetical protein